MNFYAEVREDITMEGVWVDEYYKISTFDDTYLIRGEIEGGVHFQQIVESLHKHPFVVRLQVDMFGMSNEKWRETKAVPIKTITMHSAREDLEEYLHYHKSLGNETADYDKWFIKKEKDLPLPIVRKMIRLLGETFEDKRNPYERLAVFILLVDEETYQWGNLLQLGYSLLYQPQIRRDLVIVGKKEGTIEELSSLAFVHQVREERTLKLGKSYV